MSLQEWLSSQVVKIKTFYKKRINQISATVKDKSTLEQLLNAEVTNCKQALNHFKSLVFKKLNSLQQNTDNIEAENLLKELN